jgi:hypothetical protein
MRARMARGSIFILLVLALPAYAGGKGDLQKYFSDATTKVKGTNDPSEKRKILSETFHNVYQALDIVQNLPLISKEDAVSIDRFKATIQEKQNELAGINGYERVSDEQLNSFSDYVVQDMEQADQVVTISLVALLLIIILVVLLVR